MSKKLRVGVLFGGRSAEHEISLQSASNIIEAIDTEKFEVLLIGIDKRGRWLSSESSRLLLNMERSEDNSNRENNSLALIPGETESKLIKLDDKTPAGGIDVIFPVLHGPFGEDGTVQGLLRLINIPFVGSGVLGSSVGMDKDIMKRLLRDSGIPISKYEIIQSHEQGNVQYDAIKKRLGLPLFIKPANLGSSVGVHKVRDKNEFEIALKDAFQFDNKVLAEEFIQGREIECAVLGNEYPEASVPGEILTNHDFYSYEAKYIDEKGAVLDIPAKLPEETSEKIRDIAIQAFRAGCCEGMARVDFFLRDDGGIVVNEINTIPGFTSISMYPKLWEASGIKYGDLIERLIELALERHEKEERLQTNYAVDK
jgi:D-alanine-D-alanine ligase